MDERYGSRRARSHISTTIYQKKNKIVVVTVAQKSSNSCTEIQVVQYYMYIDKNNRKHIDFNTFSNQLKWLSKVHPELTLWFATSVGISTFRKQFWGCVFFLISPNRPQIIGKHTSAASLKSFIVLFPSTLQARTV